MYFIKIAIVIFAAFLADPCGAGNSIFPPISIGVANKCYLKNVATSLYLTVDQNGAVVTAPLGQGAGLQKWVLQATCVGGVCAPIDITEESTSKHLGNSDLGGVQLQARNDGQSQKWCSNLNSGSVISYVNCATNLLLDSNAAGSVYMHVGNGGVYQKWECISY